MSHEMSVDEAIADCVRQVPECAPAEDSFVLGWDDVEGASVVSSETPAARALWFDAAWEWLQARVDWDTYEVRFVAIGKWTVRHSYEAGMGRGSRDIGTFPTKTHALCGAVLLAKGLEP